MNFDTTTLCEQKHGFLCGRVAVGVCDGCGKMACAVDLVRSPIGYPYATGRICLTCAALERWCGAAAALAPRPVWLAFLASPCSLGLIGPFEVIAWGLTP